MLHDQEYVERVGMLLDRFHLVQGGARALYNCRCPNSPPFCGDSDQSVTKARGYFYWTDKGYRYKCHNCGISLSLRYFLKEFDETLFKEYVFKTAFEERQEHRKRDEPKEETASGDEGLPEFFVPLTKLGPTDPVIRYVRSRKLPQTVWPLLYKIERFSDVVKYAPRYLGRIKGEETRLVIPVRDRGKRVVQLICRAVEDHALRYYNIKIVEEATPIFGIDRVAWNRQIIVLEGALDSLFLPNAVAVAGADLHRAKQFLPAKSVFVWDNQPRNKDVVRHMINAVREGMRIVVWPEDVGDKDINAMVLSGIKPDDIVRTISDNTVDGLEAELRIAKWKRVDTGWSGKTARSASTG